LLSGQPLGCGPSSVAAIVAVIVWAGPDLAQISAHLGGRIRKCRGVGGQGDWAAVSSGGRELTLVAGAGSGLVTSDNGDGLAPAIDGDVADVPVARHVGRVAGAARFGVCAVYKALSDCDVVLREQGQDLADLVADDLVPESVEGFAGGEERA